MENVNIYVDKGIRMLMEYGPKALLAILVLIIGLSVIGSLKKMITKKLTKQSMDPTLTPFLVNLVSWGAKVMLFISVASMVGIATTSFVAVVGAAGLAVGLAMQGSLANFAGGVLILIFRYFKKGDFIEAQGQSGTVEAIEITATTITTADNQKVILPNGPLAGGTIINYTANENRRANISIGISYDDDIRTAIKVIKDMCNKNSKVLKDPEVSVFVESYGDNSINLTVRPWAKTTDFWPMYWEIMEQMKYSFDEAGLNMPYPQRDVHIFNEK